MLCIKINPSKHIHDTKLQQAVPQGMQMHRKAVDERLSHTSPGQSFLARQRQVSSARRSHPGSVQR